MTDTLSMCIERLTANPAVAPSVIEFLRSPRRKLLFGAATQAAVCLAMFRDMNLPVTGLLVGPSGEKTFLRGYWGDLLRRAPLFRTSDFPLPREDFDVLLTVPSFAYAEAEQRLRSIGFPHVYTCAWGSNMNLKNACYEVYRARFPVAER